jgi:hypothetical protein
MSDITPARKLFDLLISRDFDPEMLDSSGKPAPDPGKANIFSFDFRARSGKDYGTVVLLIDADNNLELYCADNVARGMEGNDKNDWFAFLEQLKHFAVTPGNFKSFGIKNLNRLRYSMQGQAAIKEGLFESWTGNRTTSWNGTPTEARLMIRHKKTIGEGDARFRHIESLFIETADSERYRLPFTSLTAGRAMLEHVRQGGRPYDPRGNHIAEMVTELSVLSRFRRANAGQIFEGDTAQLVEQVQEYQANLQRSLKGIGTRTGYTKYFESWSPADISEQDVVIESLKSLFVKQTIDTRIESALPLLAKIQQQGTAMKEANIFEAWAERLVEGTWQLPDTPEKQAELLELMSTDLPVGADATNVTEQLYNLLGDDELFDQLEALAEQDANADARQVIYDRMQMLSDHPDVLKVIEQLQIDPTAEMNPPEATNPADLEPMNESRMLDEDGSKLEHILNRFKHEVKTFEQGGDLDDDLYHALFDYWNDAGEIPYGVQKARDGDPYEWVAQNLESHLSGGGIVGGNPDEDYGIERESVMHGDYAEEKNRMRELAGLPQETDEGWKAGAAGAGIGALVGGPLGAVIGGGLGGAIEEDDKEKKSGSSVLPAVAAGVAGAGLGYMAGKAASGSSTKAPTSSSSSTTGSDRYGSWGAPGAPTATGKGLGIDPPAAGSSADIALTGMLENEVDETSPGEMMSGALSANPITSVVKGASNTAGKVAGLGDVASKSFQSGKQSMTAEDDMEEGELGTAVGAGLGGAVGGIGGAALGGLAGHYLTKDKEVKKVDEASPGEMMSGALSANPITSVVKGVSNTAGKVAGLGDVAKQEFAAGKQSMTKESDLDRISSLAGIKKKVADESLLAPLVGAVGGAALGGELASGIGSKFGSEVGGSIGQAAGQEQAGKLGALVGGMKGSSAGAAAGGEAAKKFGQVAGGIAGLAGGAAIDQAKKSNDDEETNEGWKGQLAGGLVGTVGGGMAGAALGGPIGAMIGSAAGGGAGGLLGDKLGGPDNEEQLNEFIGPAIAGVRALIPVLSRVGPALGRMASQGGKAVGQVAKQSAPVVGQAAKQGAEVVAKNAAPIGVGVGAYQAITDTAKSLVGGVGEVYHDIGSATEAITKFLGSAVNEKTIGDLATAAVKYAIPIGILLAVLYGGKKLIDAVLGESQEETDEGVRGALAGGAVGGYATRSIKGAVAGAKLGSAIQDRFAKKDDTSPLAGQYGHSGKMKEVGKDTSFLDRLKELSGLKR